RLPGHPALEAAPLVRVREGLGALRRLHSHLPSSEPEPARAGVPAHRGLGPLLLPAVLLRQALGLGPELGAGAGAAAGPGGLQPARATGGRAHVADAGVLSAISRYGARWVPHADAIVEDCRSRGQLAEGPHVAAFEAAFEERLGGGHAVTTSRG